MRLNNYKSGLEIKGIWRGRISSPAFPNQYYHENIQFLNVPDLTKAVGDKSFALLGYATHQGVIRNKGREGAELGPKSIRKSIASLVYHHSNINLFDAGDIDGQSEMERLQDDFSAAIQGLAGNNYFPIGLGGGHDISYAHYRGLKEAFPEKRIGILNFDAHFDLRPVVESPNSGTPFYQIMNEYFSDSCAMDYAILGIRKSSNTKELFSIADSKSIWYEMDNECNKPECLNRIKQRLLAFLAPLDSLYITIDMDAFPSSISPGVSAASPFGIQLEFAKEILKLCIETKKLISLDFAETNPIYDENGLTSTLVAGLLDFTISCSD